jgi:hypothetical protein
MAYLDSANIDGDEIDSEDEDESGIAGKKKSLDDAGAASLGRKTDKKAYIKNDLVLKTDEAMAKLLASIELPNDCPTLLSVGVYFSDYVGPGNFLEQLRDRVWESISLDQSPCKRVFKSLYPTQQHSLNMFVVHLQIPRNTRYPILNLE